MQTPVNYFTTMRNPTSELISLMIYEIEHVFGRKVASSRDCIELSTEIYNKTEHQLNSNTLRRFFGLVKAEYLPSQSTLTILCQYCGYSSTEDLYKQKTAETFEIGEVNKESIVQYFINIFRDSPIKNNHDHTLLSITLQTIKFLNSNQFLTDKFQSLIAKTPNGLHYYYEKLVNIDKLNSFYGNGLRFYLKEKGTVDAEIFTASIYTMKYWLSDEPEKLIKSAAILLSDKPMDVKIHPYLKARFFSALLFYHHTIQTNDDSVKKQILTFFDSLISTPGYNKYLYYYTFIVSFAMILTDHPREGLDLIQQTNNKAKPFDEDKSFDYTDSYTLLEVFALYKLGQSTEAKTKLATIKSDEFPFLIKKLMSIIYMSLRIKLSDRTSESKERLLVLLHETGFKKLDHVTNVAQMAE